MRKATWPLICAFSLLVASATAINPANLRCEYRKDPLGIDVTTPRLSWILESELRAEKQSAYRVLVASSPELLARGEGDLWDSHRTQSDRNTQIEYAGTKLHARSRCYWKVCVWGRRDTTPHWSQAAYWTLGLLSPSDWKAKWIGAIQPPKVKPVPIPAYLRKEFTVGTRIKRATLYATALGLYELMLNGKRVGDQLLAPEWTMYTKRVQYQTYDVTDMIRRGANAIGATLGNGWYCGLWQQWSNELKPVYGKEPSLLTQLELEMTDGSRQTVISDGSWTATTEGPMRFSGIYEGETYDARLEMPGWDRPHFDASGWTPAKVMTPEPRQIVWQRSEPIRVTQELPAVGLTEPKPGVFVFDFGQNFAGWCRLKLNQPAGTAITLKHNEVLNPDGTVYMENLHAGHLSTGDRQIVRYTCRGGGIEVYEPHFTSQGFRYVEVTGLQNRPTLQTITGRVFHSSFSPSGSFSCSSPLVNRLAENIVWSQRSNMIGVPTDCCQRDERCGYTGDAQFFMPTAIYNFDVAAFFNKWLVDVCEDSQRPDGGFSDHAPDIHIGISQNVGWCDAGIICPYVIYRTYGDTRVISDHYEAMKRCLAMMIRTSNGNTRGPDHVGNGDWLSFNSDTPKEVIGTAYYAYDFLLMAEMANVIGKTPDAKEFAAKAGKIVSAFGSEMIAQDGRIKGDTQTDYALAFTMGLVPSEKTQLLSLRFADAVDLRGGKLSTGFIGTPRLLPGLHAAGRDDEAYRLLLQEEMPSWLFPVKNGATTVWERWNGWTPKDGFADNGMNSFNHYSFGAVGEYLFGEIGGIREIAPGYKKIRIAPVIRKGLTWAKTRYHSIQGRIVSDWKVEAGRVTMDVMIPVNTAAEVYVPCRDRSSIHPSAGARLLRLQDGAAVFEVGSGIYRFSSAMPD